MLVKLQLKASWHPTDSSGEFIPNYRALIGVLALFCILSAKLDRFLDSTVASMTRGALMLLKFSVISRKQFLGSYSIGQQFGWGRCTRFC